MKPKEFLRVFASIAGGVAIIVGLATNVEWLSKSISQLVAISPIGRNNTLRGLTLEVPISEFKAKLGNPKIINQHKRLREYVFVDKSFYVNALTELATDKVVFLAITSRRADFSPVFTSPGYPESRPSFKVSLGKDVFSKPLSDNEPSWISGCVGANWFGYYETHYLGRPGAYQYFGFGMNQLGYLANPDFSLLLNADMCEYSSKKGNTISAHSLNAISRWRASTVINTYAISIEPIEEVMAEVSRMGILGVDSNQVMRIRD
jgi:hypothetical protein